MKKEDERIAHLVPECDVGLVIVNDRPELLIPSKVSHKEVHAFDRLHQVDDQVFLALTFRVRSDGRREEITKKTELTCSFSVRTTSSIALPRMVGSRFPIVAYANEYSWYPTDA